MEERNNIIMNKSFSFAIRIVNCCSVLRESRKEYVISKQLLKSGTAIGALLRESKFAESRADFIHKLHIALKEGNETDYWLLLLKETKYIDSKEYESLNEEIKSILKLLVSIIKSTKKI